MVGTRHRDDDIMVLLGLVIGENWYLLRCFQQINLTHWMLDWLPHVEIQMQKIISLQEMMTINMTMSGVRTSDKN